MTGRSQVDEGEGPSKEKKWRVPKAWRQEGCDGLVPGPQGVWTWWEVIDHGSHQKRPRYFIMRKWRLIPHSEPKHSAEVQAPGQEEFGGHPHLHFPVRGN